MAVARRCFWWASTPSDSETGHMEHGTGIPGALKALRLVSGLDGTRTTRSIEVRRMTEFIQQAMQSLSTGQTETESATGGSLGFVKDKAGDGLLGKMLGSVPAVGQPGG